MPGTLFVVATPIGNLEDITLRALRVLKSVAVIAAEDTRRTARLLARHAIATSTTSLHEHNEHRKTPTIISRLLQGDDIALVSDAGTPTVSDPGAGLIRAAIEAGIRVEPIPGPSAALAALVASGLSTETFTFLGFPPTRSRDRSKWFDAVATAGRTVVFFEAPHRIQRTLRELQERFGDVHVVLAREITKKHEELVRGPISLILKVIERPLGEFTVVTEIGRSTELSDEIAAGVTSILEEFGRLIDFGAGRREAISELARRYGHSSKEIYALIERAKQEGIE